MSTNPIDQIQSYYEELTKTDHEIAVFIINNPREAARLSIGDLAKITKVSKSAIVRFCNHIGYSGFSEFRFDLSRFLVSQNSTSKQSEQESDPIVSITETYCEYIRDIQNACQYKDLIRVADLIIQSRYRKILGINRTFNSANQLRCRFSKIGLDAEAVQDLAIMNDLSDLLTEQDVVILFTIADTRSSYREMVKTFHSHHVPVICFTMSQALSFKKQCKEYIVLPRISRDSSISFLDDQAVYYVFIELLLDAIASRLQEH